jgi:hypothetical protein
MMTAEVVVILIMLAVGLDLRSNLQRRHQAQEQQRQVCEQIDCLIHEIEEPADDADR